MATLLNHIVHVIQLGAQEQMINAHAKRIVAFVQDKKAVGNLSSLALPGVMMNASLLAIPGNHPITTASPATVASPIPARISLFHLLPESLFYWAMSRTCLAGFRAEFSLQSILSGSTARAWKHFLAPRTLQRWAMNFHRLMPACPIAKLGLRMADRVLGYFASTGLACVVERHASLYYNLAGITSRHQP